MNENSQNSSTKRIIYFFLISHGIPFFITLLIIVIEKSVYITNPYFGKLILIGLLSPTFAAFLIVHNFYKREERLDYWKSIVEFKRISWQWYLFIISFPIFIKLLSSLIYASLTNNNIQFNVSSDMNLSYAFILLFFGPLPEEIGWRGVGLPELQKKFGFNFAVLFLGFMWAIWHLPLFFIVGTYQYNLGLFTPLFWNFMLRTVFISVVYGVIFNNTKKSILAVVLFHYFSNLIGEAFVITLNAQIISTVLYGFTALSILIYYGKRRTLAKSII